MIRGHWLLPPDLVDTAARSRECLGAPAAVRAVVGVPVPTASALATAYKGRVPHPSRYMRPNSTVTITMYSQTPGSFPVAAKCKLRFSFTFRIILKASY